MDEPTSNLDPEAEYKMYHRFNDLVKGRSALFISHRLASCKFCDRILVLRDGRIVEQGSHNDLVEGLGYYARLFAMQAELYDVS
ncbi:MAG: hypothetical protein Q4A52_02640 [Bacillota bacterium]|nr:hypothetical protein [Bacillota bacterium]